MVPTLAQAASHGRDARDDRGHSQQHHKRQKYQHQQQRQHRQLNRRDDRRHVQQRRHSASSSHGWRRGGHVPRSYYANTRYWVNDWRGHRLSRPPHGHRWLHVDGRYVLTAIASGVITSIILGH